MYQHVLLIYSDYTKGKRIAFHKCYECLDKMYEFLDICDEIKDEFQQLTFSFHHIQTKERDVNSISSYDKYFCDIEYYTEVEKFIRFIKADTTIEPIDIAKAILCKKSLSPLELEKIMYFTYFEYMKVHGLPMFLEEFQAWKYGPVIPEVYSEFKKYGRDKVELEESSKLIIYSKIMKFDSYDKILEVIDKTLEEYKNYTATQLVDKSHAKDSPWDKVYKNGEGQNDTISKEIIKNYIFSEYLDVV